MKILFPDPYFPIQPIFFNHSQFDSNNIAVEIIFKSVFKLHSFLGRWITKETCSTKLYIQSWIIIRIYAYTLTEIIDLELLFDI